MLERKIAVLCLLVAALGCATVRARRACRPTCQDLRGPVWSFGGPTIPGKSWDECMSACELEATP